MSDPAERPAIFAEALDMYQGALFVLKTREAVQRGLQENLTKLERDGKPANFERLVPNMTFEHFIEVTRYLLAHFEAVAKAAEGRRYSADARDLARMGLLPGGDRN